MDLPREPTTHRVVDRWSSFLRGSGEGENADVSAVSPCRRNNSRSREPLDSQIPRETLSRNLSLMIPFDSIRESSRGSLV